MMIRGSRILVVGLGNMGGALVEGFLAKGIEADKITALDTSPHAVARAKALGIDLVRDPEELAHNPQFIILAVKPQLMDVVAPVYKYLVSEAVCFISVAAGQTLTGLKQHLGPAVRLIRAMPNTPAAVGAGMTVLCGTGNLAVEQMAVAETLMGCVGRVAWVDDEALMDAVTAVSGSGPAYFFMVMESLEAAGIAQGLPQDIARTLAVQTAYGAGKLAVERAPEASPTDLRVAVTSPGGTTEAGLNALKSAGLGAAVQSAVEAATKRSKELA
jgi:pyrroline-5-carboxylate reductase